MFCRCLLCAVLFCVRSRSLSRYLHFASFLPSTSPSCFRSLLCSHLLRDQAPEERCANVRDRSAAPTESATCASHSLSSSLDRHCAPLRYSWSLKGWTFMVLSSFFLSLCECSSSMWTPCAYLGFLWGKKSVLLPSRKKKPVFSSPHFTRCVWVAVGEGRGG